MGTLSEPRRVRVVASPPGRAADRPWCDTCHAILRKPEGGRACPVCQRGVLSTEQLNEPNHLLYWHWRGVFPRIPGFEHCVCLRRVPCPGRPATDMDFVLIEPAPHARLGLVEVEGWDSRRQVPILAPKGLDQVEVYVRAFQRYAGQGAAIARARVDAAFDPSRQRGESNARWWGNRTRWTRALRGVRSRRDLEHLLTAASRTLVPILLYFRGASGPPTLTSAEARALAGAFSPGRLYAGTVAWPQGDALLSGGYI